MFFFLLILFNFQVSTSEELMEKATAAELILKAKCEDLEFEVGELKLKMEAQKQQVGIF